MLLWKMLRKMKGEIIKMIEFKQKLIKLLEEFNIENCNEKCDNCVLGKIILEFECDDYFNQYNTCDLLDIIKDRLK